MYISCFDAKIVTVTEDKYFVRLIIDCKTGAVIVSLPPLSEKQISALMQARDLINEVLKGQDNA